LATRGFRCALVKFKVDDAQADVGANPEIVSVIIYGWNKDGGNGPDLCGAVVIEESDAVGGQKLTHLSLDRATSNCNKV
jgi:hypothetical protein